MAVARMAQYPNHLIRVNKALADYDHAHRVSPCFWQPAATADLPTNAWVLAGTSPNTELRPPAISGDLIYDTTAGLLKVFDGTDWNSAFDVGGGLESGGVTIEGVTLDDGDLQTNSITEQEAGQGVQIASDITGASGKSDFRHRIRVRLLEDFIPAAGATLPAPWAIQDTSSAGSPTLDYVDDALNGEFTLAHDSQSEAQALTLYWGDQLAIDVTKKPMMEVRLKINFAGAAFTADQRIVIGFASARNATLDSVAVNAWFRIEGANLNILKEGDDGSLDTDDVDTTIDIVDNTYVTLRIDLASLSAVGFYVDGVAAGGAAIAIAAATGGIQPFIEIQRDAGAEIEAVHIDYIDVEWDRI